MIAFKENIQDLLPYDREHYIEYLDDDFDSPTNWNGVSSQLDIEKIGETQAVEIFESFFKNTVSKLDSGSFWVINHDDYDMKWFPWKEEEDTLPALRAVFKQNKVPNKFIGAMTVMKDDLFKLAKDLILYPYGPHEGEFRYKNLDISHSELPFIIKITGHLDIDLLSTDKMLLRKIVSENTGEFNVKQYRGTSLWS